MRLCVKNNFNVINQGIRVGVIESIALATQGTLKNKVFLEFIPLRSLRKLFAPLR